MTPAAFIDKWSRSELRERQGAQEHFIDLCRLIGEPTPAEADPSGATYCFERGATKVGGGDGWADVWRGGCFGWEYKGKHKDLNAALRQLQIYAPDLENPPYLVVCDMERIVVHTNWTNTVRRTLIYTFEDLREQVKLDQLRQVFRGSDSLKPGISPQELTAKVATRFGDLGKRLQERGHEPRAVAHFLNRLIFCLFAEDAEILPRDLFTRMLRNVSYEQYNIPRKSKAQFDALFATMKVGGFFGADTVRWFNGGLFDAAEALPLERDDLDMLVKTAKEHDWSNIDPAVFGTMFEAALKTTGRRAALGAHYTDREKILKIVEPVIVRPLAAEWETALAALKAETDLMAAADAERGAVHESAARDLSNGGDRNGEAVRRKTLAAIAKRRDAAYGRAIAIRDAFLGRLAAFRVLDPACGSGNFLYVALQALRDIELRALLDADRLGVPQVRPRVNLDAVRGIEIEPYAAELARVTLWIGNLQWERRNGYTDPEEPVLAALETIECRDALLNQDGSEAVWPEADVIVGNPPFLGAKLMKRNLGVEKTEAIRSRFSGRLPGFTDFVCYWFEKARAIIEDCGFVRVGLVATNSIRKNTNLPVLHRVSSTTRIFEAWSEQQWAIGGAAVDVSIVCFGNVGAEPARLDGEVVPSINADLTTGLDLTAAKPLRQNRNSAFLGIQKSGPFDVTGEKARAWMREPANPNGHKNSDALKPYWNGDDLSGRPRDLWFIDLPLGLSEEEASLFASLFQHIATTPDEHGKTVKQLRIALGERAGPRWWEPHWPRPDMRSRIEQVPRYIVTAETAQYRVFVWLSFPVLPDKNLIVIPREDDLMFGLLQSRFHAVWALRKGSDLEDRPRYTHTSVFATFPFPEGMTPDVAPEIARKVKTAPAIEIAAARLNDLRNGWLYPSDMVVRAPDVVPGYPQRILPKDEAASAVLKKRTLTNLYNERPAWLVSAHRKLDEAVAAAYDWPTDLSDGEILTKLFALNQKRAAAGL